MSLRSGWYVAGALGMFVVGCGSDEGAQGSTGDGAGGNSGRNAGGANTSGNGALGGASFNGGRGGANSGDAGSSTNGGSVTTNAGGGGGIALGAGGLSSAAGGRAAGGGVVGLGGQGGDIGEAGAGGESSCVPKSCAELFLNCGNALDNCGRPLACGSCAAGTVCGASGVANVCGVKPGAPNCREGWCWTHRASFGGDFGGIAAFATNDVWFVGAHGTLWHWNGTKLEDKSPEGERAWLYNMWGAAPGELWVSARDGIRHYVDGAWSREALPELGSSDMLRWIWGTGTGENQDVWAATSSRVFHRVGGVWTSVGPTGSSILGAWASSPSDVWVVGGTTSGPFVRHFDGNAWASVDIGATSGYARAVTGRSASDVFIEAGGALFHYDGSIWSNVASSIGAEPEDLWIAGDSTLWGAGTWGLLSWDGSAWHPEEVPTGLELERVRGVGSDLWVTSRLGTLLHRTGSGANASWTRLSGVGSGFSTLKRASGTAPDDVWVIPGYHSVMHFDGTRWSSIPETTNCTYSDIWVGVRGRPWLTGTKTSPISPCVTEWTGSEWIDHSRGLSADLSPRTIWGVGLADVWVGGNSGTNGLSHFDGQAWTGYATAMPILDISGVASNRVVAVGVAVTDDELRFDGTKWTAYRSNLFPNLLTPHFVTGAWMAPNGAVWIASEEGLVGSSSGKEQTVSKLDLEGIHGAGNKIWSIEGGAYGRVLERTNGWRAIETPRRRNLSGLWANSENDAWFIGTGGLIHYDGERYSDNDGVAFWSVSQISLLNDNDVWAAAGDYVLHWDGGDWLEHFAASDTLSTVAAVDSTHVYAGSGIDGNGALFLWNGQTWAQIWSSTWWSVRAIFALGPNDVWFVGKGSNAVDKVAHYDGKTVVNDFDGPLSGGFATIWGSSSSDIWAGGDAGSLVHYDGVSWQKRTAPTTHAIVSLWGASASDMWLVGGGACEIYHFDGAQFVPYSIPDCASVTFNEVSGRAADDVWFAGGDSLGGRVLHFDGAGLEWVQIPYSSSLAAIAASASSVWAGASWDVLRMRR